MKPKNQIKLWLDDVRDPVYSGRAGWTWVRTAEAAIALLDTGNVIEASLDHDLDTSASIGQSPTERTGYDVVLWMEEHDVWPPNGVHVHSQNPAGAKRMLQAIHRAYSKNSR
jgi:hypothetical protein